MLAGLAHLATAPRTPFFLSRSKLHTLAKEVRVQGVFVVFVVSSLTGTPLSSHCSFSVAVASKCFGLISFEKKKKAAVEM